MNAELVITFTDGSQKVLPLGEKLSEIDVPHHMRQSISLNQTAMGGLHLSYTKPLFENKSWTEFKVRKCDASSAPATPSPAQGTA